MKPIFKALKTEEIKLCHDIFHCEFLVDFLGRMGASKPVLHLVAIGTFKEENSGGVGLICKMRSTSVGGAFHPPLEASECIEVSNKSLGIEGSGTGAKLKEFGVENANLAFELKTVDTRNTGHLKIKNWEGFINTHTRCVRPGKES